MLALAVSPRASSFPLRLSTRLAGKPRERRVCEKSKPTIETHFNTTSLVRSTKTCTKYTLENNRNDQHFFLFVRLRFVTGFRGWKSGTVNQYLCTVRAPLPMPGRAHFISLYKINKLSWLDEADRRSRHPHPSHCSTLKQCPAAGRKCLRADCDLESNKPEGGETFSVGGVAGDVRIRCHPEPRVGMGSGNMCAVVYCACLLESIWL
jgi:hypothetical protein